MKKKVAGKLKTVRKRFRKDDLELMIISSPTVLWFLAFSYVPLFGIIFAFKNYRLTPGKGFIYSLFVSSKWVGLKNFEFLFRTPDLGNILRNTLLYNVAFIIIGVSLPVVLAVLIHEMFSKKLAKACQTAMFLPHFLSWVVVSYFAFAFLSSDKGLLNYMRNLFGQADIMWYQSPQYWPFILIFINTWKTIGYSMVIYMASITSIDTTMYESAVIDGASKWQQIKGITLPMLRPVISIMLILNLGHIFSTDFGLFYIVTRDSGSILSVTQTLDVYVYKALMQQNNYNYSAAVSLFQSVLGCILILISNKVVKRIDPESGLF